MRNVKLAFVGNSAVTMYNFRASLLADMMQKGYDVTVLVPVDTDLAALNSIGVKVIPIRVDCRGTNPRNDMALLWQLVKIYRQEQFDFIFHYTIKPNIYGSLAARLCGIPSTAMVAGLGYVFNNKGIGNVVARRLFRFALRFPQHIFVLNAFNKALMLEKRIARPEQIIFLEGGEGINLSYYQI